MMDRINQAAAVLPVCLVFAASVSAQEPPVSAQETSGFYISTNLGFTSALGSDVGVLGVNRPTRCDRLLYANPADAPADEECLAPLTSSREGAYRFGQNFGTAQALALGYAVENLRFEVEILLRSQTGEATSLNVGSNKPLTDKDTEWSAITPPNAEAGVPGSGTGDEVSVLRARRAHGTAPVGALPAVILSACDAPDYMGRWLIVRQGG